MGFRLIAIVTALVLPALVLFSAGPASGADLQLVMVEEDGCGWCQAWHQEIGPIYPKTAEGRAAPLRRIDINDRMPDDLAAIPPTRFTPTFILVSMDHGMGGGREVGRINGYPGDAFFWGLLQALIARHRDGHHQSGG